ncbi:MAG: hypothetical protein Ct9H90mP18_02570 [Gammaproteobacteria bacterium]|nr:MAG: hypothetical protein Ct9H90mP18_02570 [Gammaproteobacteria bacterium]
MLESKIVGAEFIVANTDSQALAEASKKGATMIQIGSDITKGLGAGADPEKGRQAALEAKEELSALYLARICYLLPLEWAVAQEQVQHL